MIMGVLSSLIQVSLLLMLILLLLMMRLLLLPLLLLLLLMLIMIQQGLMVLEEGMNQVGGVCTTVAATACLHCSLLPSQCHIDDVQWIRCMQVQGRVCLALGLLTEGMELLEKPLNGKLLCFGCVVA